MKAQNNNTASDFEAWILSDNVVRGKGKYTTQCSQWKKEFTRAELESYFIQEYGEEPQPAPTEPQPEIKYPEGTKVRTETGVVGETWNITVSEKGFAYYEVCQGERVIRDSKGNRTWYESQLQKVTEPTTPTAGDRELFEASIKYTGNRLGALLAKYRRQHERLLNASATAVEQAHKENTATRWARVSRLKGKLVVIAHVIEDLHELAVVSEMPVNTNI